MSEHPRPSVTAVVLAYGDEPWVERCVEALLASEGVDVDVVLVDNGCTTGAPDRLEGRAGVEVVRPGENLGFAGGCNAGAALARGELLALVNADALVAPEALARLGEVAREPEVGLASGSIRLADDPERLNSAGNPLHFSGLSWAGAFGEPAADHAVRTEVLGASGAGVLLRRQLWEELGGFAPEYFAYLEDTELSLRCWQRGLRVVFVPDAVVVHRYEFSRNPLKMYLLERNRLLLVLTLLERRTLLALLPVLVLVELCMVALS
ncbi:MAG: glycosyl transferase family 2, partial [Frankiales bacterium]|nr:glycosyl transferase family 2 [Frankiales bacterium]